MEILLSTPTSSFWIVPDFTSNLFSELNTLSLATKPPIKVYGKVCHQQRDVGFFSSSSKGYNYSNTMTKALPMTSLLEELLEKVNSYLDTKFNGILVNRYNTGTDYLSAHSDSEKGLDRNKMVAGLSFGATRTFRIRDKKTNKIIKDYQLPAGTLYVMDGEFQQEFKHEIPIQKIIKDARISLTFRTHLD